MNNLSKRIKLLQKLNKDKKLHKFLNKVENRLYFTLRLRNCVYTAGCGGSHGSGAEHLTGELVGRFKRNRKAFNSECLSGASAGVITAIVNDYGFKFSISRQLEGKAKSLDVFICFSTSGNSPNIVEALKWCKKNNRVSFAFLGKTGGKAKHLATYSYIVPSNDTAFIQEIHLAMLHMLMERLENET